MAAADSSRPRPPISFNTLISEADNEAWKINAHYWPCPTNGFSGKKVEVFWDMENCPLTGCWCPEYNWSDRVTFADKLTAQQHYDLLYSIFARDTGVRMQDFTLHLFISDDTLQRHYSKARQADISQHHSNYTINHRCGGKSAGKASQHEADTHINSQIQRFCDSRSRPGDIIVLISGDADHMAVIRKAVQEYDIHVCQLYIEGAGKTSREWLFGTGYDLVSWAEPWHVFLEYHRRKNPFNRRPSAKDKAQHVSNILRESLAYEESLGKIGIVLLLDITDSMQPAIDDVKAKLEAQLLVELQERYPSMRGKFHFAVVGYRDVHSSKRFEVHDFDPDVANVAEFLKSLRATSGRDHPEDVVGGLMEVCKLKGWGKTASNILFHIFDAPGHGKRFNDVFHEGSPHFPTFGGDDYWEHPPKGQRDPSVEIAAAIDQLKNDLNVVKYYAVTIRTANYVSLPVAPTARTVAALKEISMEVPVRRIMQSDILSHSNTDCWVEEVDIGVNAAALVNVMVGAASRTLGATASTSRTMATLSSSRNTFQRDKVCTPIVEGYENMRLETVSGLSVTLPSAGSSGGLLSNPLPPVVGRPAAVAAAPSTAYQKWADGGDGKAFLQEMEKVFKAIAPVQECEVSQLHPPADIGELCYVIIDGRKALDTLNPSFPKRSYKVMEEPFAKGAERFAHLALNLTAVSRQKLHVLKQFRLEGHKMMSIDRLKLLHTTQTVAGFLANEFSGCLETVCPEEIKLKYLEVSLVRFHVYQSSKSSSPRNMFAEEFLLGKLVKYNDNGGAGAPQADFLPSCDAFPHWTYHVTGGRLMVTDVQGWLDQEARVVRLTDPCIHCQDLGFLDDANKDRWLQGMEDFFKSHTCGATCKALQLDVDSPPRKEIAKLRARILKALADKDDGSGGGGSGASGSGGGGGREAASGGEEAYTVAVENYIADLRKAIGMQIIGSAEATDAAAASGSTALAPSGASETSTTTSFSNAGTPSPPPAHQKVGKASRTNGFPFGTGNGRAMPALLAGGGSGKKDKGKMKRSAVLCRFFQSGSCDMGADCEFKHQSDKPCRYFAQGSCRQGDRCWYRHE